jgi:hypothetical protein
MARCHRADGGDPNLDMKEQFHIVLITVALFAAGLLTGVWTQRTRPIPPPVPVLGEFGALPAPGLRGFGMFARTAPEHGAMVAGMGAKIAALEPKIKAFQASVDAIEQRFVGDLNRVLTPEQQKKLAALRAQSPEGVTALGAAPYAEQIPAPPSFGEFGPPPPPMHLEMEARHLAPPFPIGGWLLMSMIIYQPALDRLNAELNLNPAQQAAVKQLMVERRSKLLALIDSNPPPTLGFGKALPWTAAISSAGPQSPTP